jgi:hypothetical protein
LLSGSTSLAVLLNEGFLKLKGVSTLYFYTYTQIEKKNKNNKSKNKTGITHLRLK